jgi:hypothetical protein
LRFVAEFRAGFRSILHGDSGYNASAMSSSKPSLVRPEYAKTMAAVGILKRVGALSPADAALARVQAFWKAERNAAEAEGMDLDAIGEAGYRKVISRHTAN